jgi:hypothetical protein
MDWRECGILMIPEMKPAIESAVNLADLWVSLQMECESACKSGDIQLAKKVFDFAWYCVRSKDDDLASMTAVAFYEHVPTMLNVKNHLIEFFTESQFDDFSELFKYFLNPIQHERLLHEFRQCWKALPHNVRRQREAEVPKNKTDVSAHASDPVTENQS